MFRGFIGLVAVGVRIEIPSIEGTIWRDCVAGGTQDSRNPKPYPPPSTMDPNGQYTENKVLIQSPKIPL